MKEELSGFNLAKMLIQSRDRPLSWGRMRCAIPHLYLHFQTCVFHGLFSSMDVLMR